MNAQAKIIAIVAVALCLPLRAAGAQDAVPQTAENAAGEDNANAPMPQNGPSATSSGDSKSVGGMIVSGGTLNIIFFGVLGVFSLWAATVILERIFNLRRENLLPKSFVRELLQLVENASPNARDFQALCDGHDAPASRIFRAGVARAGRPLPEVEKSMEDAAAREMAAIRAKSRPLSVVGNIAPLVGLLGTVVGMIMAFQISSQDGLGKAERLAEGIYLALMTTAAGLTIAIPCLLFASWFQGRAERYMCDIGECLTTAIPHFAQMEGKKVNNMVIPSSMEPEADAREKFLREGIVD